METQFMIGDAPDVIQVLQGRQNTFVILKLFSLHPSYEQMSQCGQHSTGLNICHESNSTPVLHALKNCVGTVIVPSEKSMSLRLGIEPNNARNQ